jgi:hypothetical protein
MERMEPEELHAILAKAESIPIRFPREVGERIVRFSQGLPHYPHLLGLNCSYTCADQDVDIVTHEILDTAVEIALRDAAASIRKAYRDATSSAHKDALYAQVLLACALAVESAEEPFGEFRPANVLGPFRSVTSDTTKGISTFNGHLSAFTEEERGRVLTRLGTERNYRFRFTDPMLPPFVLMKAHQDRTLPAAKA